MFSVSAEMILSVGVILGGTGVPEPPLFEEGGRTPNFISTPCQKFCLVPFTFQAKVTPLILWIAAASDLSALGSLFHAGGAATEKAVSLIRRRVGYVYVYVMQIAG